MFKNILVLGSGALKIGEAGEFDYSGSQALKALKEEGIKSVLINPNIATIQTSHALADKIYFLPVNPYFVTEVIKKERPDGIMLSFGGQTALNCGLSLDEAGVLEKFGVAVLGTPVKSIETTEDRAAFSKALSEVGIKVARGGFAQSVGQALKIAGQIDYPIIIRSAFALGGLGSSVVGNRNELKQVVAEALRLSPQVSVEEYLKHWKEIEYEVVRDRSGNKITVCNMENLDPLGIHTGESIVVAPSQTLNNYQYHFLRSLSLKVIEHLKIVGECNIQFALEPKSNDYRVIEVNARLSRSSALASKATGYPLAYIAAKLGLGYELPQLKNSVTQKTSAFFEPSLDYIVVKIPRWDLQKFIGADERIGSSMKSVGEVMAIGRSFPEALQKAVRMLDINHDGLLNGKVKNGLGLKRFLTPSSDRLFSVARSLREGDSTKKIYLATGIDPWFLYQIKEIVDFEVALRKRNMEFNKEILLQAKQLGFSDKLLARAFNLSEEEVRVVRKRWDILPKVKHIDTLAAEYPAKTNYLYLTYNANETEESDNEETKNKKKAIVLGSGPYRIGSSVEFDWCCVTAAKTLREQGLESIIINCNPETVSTDFDNADKLYFEELTFERVSDIYEIEHQAPLLLAFGGQLPNNLALRLFKSNIKILGTSPLNIDSAEDRSKFGVVLDKLGIDQPFWQKLLTINEAMTFSKRIGYPVMVRPSYVLSGSAMNVAFSEKDLKAFLQQATDLSIEHPVVISKFIEGAKEIEFDGVSQRGKLLIYAISEHIENAGVHSGDSTLVLPPQRMYLETMRLIKLYASKITKALNINGPFNIQFLAKDNKVMVIELNLRASRSLPFVSKVLGHNFVRMATLVMLGEKLTGDFETISLSYVGVKASQFSFNRIKGADPKLGVDMSSTGEVAAFGEDLYEAYLKAMISTGFKMPKKNIFLSLGGDKNKVDFLDAAIRLKSLGFQIYATSGTALFLKKRGILAQMVFKISENKHPSLLDLLKSKKVDLAINLSVADGRKLRIDGFLIRRNCIDFGIPLVTNLQQAEVLSATLSQKNLDKLLIKSWDEYVR